MATGYWSCIGEILSSANVDEISADDLSSALSSLSTASRVLSALVAQISGCGSKLDGDNLQDVAELQLLVSDMLCGLTKNIDNKGFEKGLAAHRPAKQPTLIQ